jgi:ligand-binding sensor domain-containing protein
LRKFLLALLVYCGFQSLAQTTHFKQYTPSDGLANSVVYYAMQDSKGYIWFCTETGVNRFDGEQFEKFTISDGLADNEIFKAFEDSKGRIWFSSYNGKLSYYFKGKFYNENNNPRLKTNNSKESFIFDMQEDNQENILISYRSEWVLKYNNEKIISLLPPASIPLMPSTKILKYGDSTFGLWVMDSGIYIYNFTSCTAKLLPNILGLSASAFPYISKQQVQGEGTYFAHNEGIFNFTGDKLSPVLLLERINKKNTSITAFLVDDFYLWIATRGEGIMRIKKADLTLPNPPIEYLFEGGEITSILKDREGNYWVTAPHDCVYYIKKSSLKYHTLFHPTGFSVCPIAKSDSLLIGGLRVVDLYVKDHKIKSFLLDTAYKELKNRVKDIYPTQNPREFLVSADHSLYLLDAATGKVRRLLLHEFGNKKSDLTNQKYGWVAGTSSIAKYENGKVDIVYQTTYSAKRLTITSIAGVSNSTAYFGSTQRLLKFTVGQKSPDTILRYEQLQGRVNDLSWVEGSLWVATSGGGISIIKNDLIIKKITTGNSNISSDVCQYLYNDKQGYMWVTTLTGINIIDIKTHSIKHKLSVNNGLASNDIRNVKRIGDDIYVTTIIGTTKFHFKDIPSSASAPALDFKSLILPDSVIRYLGDTIEYKYIDKYIRIDFSVLSFEGSGTSSIQYMYKFDNNNWISPQSTEIQSSPLSPGFHVLHIKAKKFNSNWSNDKMLIIHILPLWYQSWLFKIFMTLSILFTTLFLLRWRIKNITRKEQEKTLVNKQLADLEGKALSSQMNPHFIFNSLNTIQTYILKKNVESGIYYLSEFALLMRQILNNSQKEAIYLEDEIGFLQNYLKLEKMRFNEQFDYKVVFDDYLLKDEIKIPPMMIQPLLENAIKHGIEPDSKDNFVTLEIKRVSDMLEIKVEDNGIGYYPDKNKNALHQSAATKVLKQRLSLFEKFGKSGSIQIVNKNDISANERGTLVLLKIPIVQY